MVISIFCGSTIVAMSHELPGDNLQGLRVGAHDELLLALDGLGVVAEGLRQLHLDRAPSCHNLSTPNKTETEPRRGKRCLILASGEKKKKK